MESTINNGMCRCCASEGTFKDVKSSYHWMGEEEIYSDMLRECFDVSLLLSEDGNDGGICEVCITQLRNAANFKKQVQHTEEQFKLRLDGKLYKSDSIVKIEPSRGEDDDNDSDNMSGDDFSGAEYEVPIKTEKLEETKPKKRPATSKPSTSRAKKTKNAEPETSTKRDIPLWSSSQKTSSSVVKVKTATIRKWISNHPELLHDHTSGIIYCTKCESNLKVISKCNITRHIEGAVHQGKFKRPQEKFYFDLIKFLILCNIPWSQMKNPAFKEFFRKYVCSVSCCACTNRKVPDESQLRKVYLDKFYKDKINSIYESNQNEKLWITLDETTDFLGRYIVRFLIKPLHQNKLSRPYLIACKMLEVVNGQTIAQFVLQCLENLWQNSFETKVTNVLVLCTDSVAYMLSAGRNLKNYLPQMKHVTCLAHALHRVSEQIRLEYHDVDILIANVKKIFLKAPSRVRILKEKYPDLPMPPQTVTTKWGTWLEAASYYAKHLDAIKDVLSNLNSSDTIAIQNAKNILERGNLQNDLNDIGQNYTVIQLALKELQKDNLTLHDSLLAFDKVRAAIYECTSGNIKNKIVKILDQNPDLDTLREYSKKIGKNEINELISYYKYAPLTSTDVERSLSTFKWILDVKRNRLKLENLEKLMIIHFNFIDHGPLIKEEIVDDGD